MKNSIFIFMIIVLGVVDISISISGLFTYVFLGGSVVYLSYQYPGSWLSILEDI